MLYDGKFVRAVGMRFLFFLFKDDINFVHKSKNWKKWVSRLTLTLKRTSAIERTCLNSNNNTDWVMGLFVILKMQNSNEI